MRLKYSNTFFRHKIFVVMLAILHLQIAGIAQNKNAVPLPHGKFRIGNDISWSSPDFNDNNWQTIKTNEVWQSQGFSDYHGYAWYRIHITIPYSLKQQSYWKDSLRLFLAHVNDVDETYLNGIKVGKTGSFPDNENGYASKWPAVREYHIAANNPAILWDKDNVIAIKVFDGGGTGGIFMGEPYVDMLEKTDGISIGIVQEGIVYSGAKAVVPMALQNKFNASLQGDLLIRVIDASSGKMLTKKSFPLSISPFYKKSLSFTVPNKPGIEIEYSFTQSNSTLNVFHKQSIPYLVTPKPLSTPHINNAPVVGVHPNTPFLFKIAATGARPLQYAVSSLPEGLQFNSEAGIITGSLADSGVYKVNITVSNSKGKATQTLTIKAGKELALTPPMGWNSWNCWGTAVSEEKVKSSAQALLDKGLADYGWNYINIDDGWQQPHRAPDSSVVPNDKFGDMKALGSWLHHKGFHFGIYSSPGPLTCGGFLGSYKNEMKDAESYAGWGVDYLKYDWCSYDGIVKGDSTFAAYIKPFALMDSCLAATGRSIVYNLCQYGMKDVWKWGGDVHAQSWRTTEDIEDTWQSLKSIGFAQYPLYTYANPGHWNDPDMMIVGQVGWGENLHPSRLTPDEQYTHVSLWCMLSAPLLIGCDISKLDAFTLNLLTNAEVLAIDQDVLGKQAERVIKNDSSEVWVKELSDGSKAVALFNLSTSYKKISVTAADANLEAASSVRDVWRQKETGILGNAFERLIPPHGVLLIKVKGK